MRRASVIFCLLVAIALLSSCAEPSPPPLPEGEQTVSGTLLPTELSLVRRGTHVLIRGDIPLFYLESKTVNIAALEGRDVTLRGVLERNTDPLDLPILVVSAVEDSGASVTALSLPEFGARFQVPRGWNGKQRDGRMEFSLSGSALPVLTLSMESLTDRSFEEYVERQAPGAEGIPVLVGQQRALRVLDEETGKQTIFVERGRDALTILFDPVVGENTEEIRSAFLAVLRSLTFGTARSATSVSPSRGTGSHTVGQPCGGSAGILCPEGQYCEVTDRDENIGRCVQYN